MAQLGVARA